MYIKNIRIIGYKKFLDYTVSFNKSMNILVGGNEAGKSTVLEAIDLVINQSLNSSNKSAFEYLFNKDNIDKFNNNPCEKNLPFIRIEIELDLGKDQYNSIDFYGQYYYDYKKEIFKYGISFELSYNEEICPGLVIEECKSVPWEYYTPNWQTFAGQTYYYQNRKLKTLFINTSKNNNNVFDNYAKSIYEEYFSEKERLDKKREFREKLYFNSENNKFEDNNTEFGINENKIDLEKCLAIFDNKIILENKGKGLESFIKTELALKNKNNFNLILMEEPECHLSFILTKKLIDYIQNNNIGKQIILTTHSDMIASNLGLQNITWICENKAKSFSNIDDKTALYFKKIDYNNFLQFVLSEKIILVEGAAEYILLPKFYKQICNKNIEEDKITIISCHGLTYKNYLNLAKESNNKVAVITDNDKNNERITDFKKFNDKNKLQHIFTGKSIEDYTFEVCLVNSNKEKLNLLNEMLDYKDLCIDKVKEKMKDGSKKTDNALKILETEIEFNVPEYIKDAIDWIRK